MCVIREFSLYLDSGSTNTQLRWISHKCVLSGRVCVSITSHSTYNQFWWLSDGYVLWGRVYVSITSAGTSISVQVIQWQVCAFRESLCLRHLTQHVQSVQVIQRQVCAFRESVCLHHLTQHIQSVLVIEWQVCSFRRSLCLHRLSWHQQSVLVIQWQVCAFKESLCLHHLTQHMLSVLVIEQQVCLWGVYVSIISAGTTKQFRRYSYRCLLGEYSIYFISHSTSKPYNWLMTQFICVCLQGEFGIDLP